MAPGIPGRNPPGGAPGAVGRLPGRAPNGTSRRGAPGAGAGRAAAAGMACAAGTGAGAGCGAKGRAGAAGCGFTPSTSSFTLAMSAPLSNGLAMCPSARAARARLSSKASKVPASSSTGMCCSSGSALIASHTS